MRISFRSIFRLWVSVLIVSHFRLNELNLKNALLWSVAVSYSSVVTTLLSHLTSHPQHNLISYTSQYLKLNNLNLHGN